MNNYFRKILITGANGQVGSSLRHHARVSDFHLIPCGRAELDITQFASIESAIKKYSPDVVINTAAFTAVDQAEQDKELAMRANFQGARHLAIACQKHLIPLIHLSTDYIFDGTNTLPYQENDKACPINVYGESKWLGEQAIREHCEQHVIVRVSGIFSEYGNNFVKTMLRLANTKKELRVVADQITCPTYASDIANALFSIVQQNQRSGTYHYCDTNPVSWYQFATAIIQIAKQSQALLVTEVKAITTSEYPTRAIRPAYSVLNCDKIVSHFAIKQGRWDDALATIIPQLLKNPDF